MKQKDLDTPLPTLTSAVDSIDQNKVPRSKRTLLQFIALFAFGIRSALLEIKSSISPAASDLSSINSTLSSLSSEVSSISSALGNLTSEVQGQSSATMAEHIVPSGALFSASKAILVRKGNSSLSVKVASGQNVNLGSIPDGTLIPLSIVQVLPGTDAEVIVLW
jgi:hypothetical protein